MAKVVYTSAKDTIVTEDNFTVHCSVRATQEDGELDIDITILDIFANVQDKRSFKITQCVDQKSKELIMDELYSIYDDKIVYGREDECNVFCGAAKGEYLCAN